MAVYTFTNADGDGDLSNADNWNIGASPAGVVPGSSDTAVLDGQIINTGSLDAPVTSATYTTINGGTFNADFTSSGGYFYGGSFGGSLDLQIYCVLYVDPGTPFTAVGCTFASGTFNTAFTDNGICSYQDGCVFNVSFVLGTGSNVNGGTFNQPITTVSAVQYINGGAFTAGCVFTGTLVSTGTFPDGTTFSNCTINDGTFGDLTADGVSVIDGTNVYGGSFTLINADTTAAFPISSGSVSGGIFVNLGTSGPENFDITYLGAPITFGIEVYVVLPDPNYPAETDVRAGVHYGIGGSDSTGTMSSASCGVGSGLIRRK